MIKDLYHAVGPTFAVRGLAVKRAPGLRGDIALMAARAMRACAERRWRMGVCQAGMGLTEHIALVSFTGDISTRNMMRVAAAIQKQLTRDYLPIWGTAATVDAFDHIVAVPNDYRPVVLFRDPSELAGRLEFAIGERRAALLSEQFSAEAIAGLHLNAFTRQPFALVLANDTWPVTASHEVLEMVTDPYGNRLRAAAHPLDSYRRVRHLLEVCDPCQAVWYPVNGIPVSDFYTPKFFDPVRSEGVRYSFTGEVTRPLQPLKGGYITWLDPDDSALYQLEGGASAAVRLAGLEEIGASGEPLRTIVDGNPVTPRLTASALRPARTAHASDDAIQAVREASAGAALRTAEAIASVVASVEAD
jgi:hypothetical protein